MNSALRDRQHSQKALLNENEGMKPGKLKNREYSLTHY